MTLKICCEASIQLFCKIKTCMFDSEIVVKSKFNTNCEANISSNVTTRRQSRWMNEDDEILSAFSDL